jgi:hypothetical protein
MPIRKWLKALEDPKCFQCDDPIKTDEFYGVFMAQKELARFQSQVFISDEEREAIKPTRLPVCRRCIETNSNSRYY